MLYEIFDSINESFGQDYFIKRVPDEIIQNLNPNFELRVYQREALGRFDFYFKDYQKKQMPVHLLFHMATGSGKTLIMAANILYLYKLGYRNFIFFVNNSNIIEKTKDNFLNKYSDKYLFAPKIVIDKKEVLVKEVQNFEGVNEEDINILFTTIQALHIRLNQPKENSITEEDFETKKIVLISDEAHHIQTLTKSNSNGNKDEERTWEYTVLKKIFEKNKENILLEFTATINLSDPEIFKKYENKLIYQYDLKQFRLDKYSKEIEVVEIKNLKNFEKILLAIILSQYKRKVAEKYKIPLKPVILFKSKTIKESKEIYDEFLNKLKNLKAKDIERISSLSSHTDLGKAFKFFEKQKISYDELVEEIQHEFSVEKIMLIDSENIDPEKQLKLNSLENRNNEIRAIFAVNMLNEGWDVLNLFDIVRLYDTRDGNWKGNKYIPGKTTLGEAQLIGRGARYFPFQLDAFQDKYKRKFDDDIDNELRVIETLHYHCTHNPKYITEIKQTLTEIGLIPATSYQLELFVKPEIKKSDLWKKGYIFVNKRREKEYFDLFSLGSFNIKKEYNFKFESASITAEKILDEISQNEDNVVDEFDVVKIKFPDLGKNVIRYALDKIKFYSFSNLKSYFPKLKSISEFISNKAFLGDIDLIISISKKRENKLTQDEKLDICLKVLEDVSENIQKNISNYSGTEEFEPYPISKVFEDKKVKIPKDDYENRVKEINLSSYYWFAQQEFYGTEEELNFINFMVGFLSSLKKKYKAIALFRNEGHFQIFDFDTGQAFEPDFVLLVQTKKNIIKSYQIFIEAKGDQFKDSSGGFTNSKEGWKQKFLMEIERRSKIPVKFSNYDYKIIGLPFYNESLKNEFRKNIEEVFNSR